jgi:hypothetical protein
VLQMRLADLSGPFFDPHKPFRNWSSFPFTQLDQPQAPYVDEAQLDWGVKRAIAHLHALQQQGYTGVVVDNLAHLVTLERAGAPADNPTHRRAVIYRRAFTRLFNAAAGLGLEVYVTSDMQWATPELRHVAGPLHPDNPRLAKLNRLALRELFSAFPQVRGVMVRVGEAGGAHNQDAAYTGHMIYTTPAALRSLIGTLLPVAEAHDRLLIVRTWSVGIGELGDLICSPERYHAVFNGFTSPHLLVSIKHGPADFFRLLPPNPTIGLPGPRQIVELQIRREYELFGLAPSSVATLHQAAIQRAVASPQVVGIWAWNSTGGWGGGTATLGATGWNLWTELGSALTAALAQEPGLDSEAFVRTWLAARLADPAYAQAAANLYLASAELLENGWYFGKLPHAATRLGSLHLAPLLWVWWMRPTAALPIWAYLTSAIGDPLTALAASRAARDAAIEFADQLAGMVHIDDAEAVFIARSARYFADALSLAYAVRALLLPLFSAAWAGRGHTVLAEPPAQQALRALRTTIAEHQARWGNRRDFPALELAEVHYLAATLEQRPQWSWIGIRAAVELVRGLRDRRAPGGKLGLAGAAGAVVLTLALLSRRPHRLRLLGLGAGLLLTPMIRRRAIQFALPRLNRRFQLLPSIFFETGPAIEEWAGGGR